MNLVVRARCCFWMMLAIAVGACSPTDECVRTEAGPAVCQSTEVDPNGVTSIGPDAWHQPLVDAAIVEKNVRIGDVTLNYAEGPPNGPPLLLLHAQHMDWYSYSRVLPELSKTFHVFAVSYHGHGLTQSPVDRKSSPVPVVTS